MNSGIPSLGTTLKHGDGASPEGFHAVAEVVDIFGSALALKTTGATHLSNVWEEVKPTLLRGGDIKLSVNFLPSDTSQSYSAGVLKDMIDRTLRHWQIVMRIFSRVVFQVLAKTSVRVRYSKGTVRGGHLRTKVRFGFELHPRGHMICTDGVYAALPGRETAVLSAGPTGAKGCGLGGKNDRHTNSSLARSGCGHG